MLLPVRMVFADNDPNLAQLQQQLSQQQKVLAELQAKLMAMEARHVAAEPNAAKKLEAKVATIEKTQAQQAQQNQAMSQKLADMATKEPNLPKSLDWARHIKISGDFRYRYENIHSEGSADNQRNRIRARLGLTAKVSDDVDTIFRIATDTGKSGLNGGDPSSTNQTLGDGLSKKDFWIDLAYFVWHLRDIPGLKVYGGKMENPFYRASSNQLIWDSDLTPEGIAVQYTTSLTDNDELFANGGGFWANQSATNTDVLYQGLFGTQGGVKHTFADKSYLLGSAGYYAYGNTQGEPTLWNNRNGYGNTVTTDAAGNTFYANEYGLMELFAEYGFNIGKTPASVYADYVNNTRATVGGDTGWLVGASYGKCKDPASWQLSYDYRDLESDAVVGVFTDSDFIGGGTNGKGHRFGATYQLTKNVQAGLTYFMDKKGNDETDYNRLQADLMFKF
jgi:hypothetical protein